MAVRFTNRAKTVLAAGIGASDTTITVGSSASFPAISGGDYFYTTIYDASTVEIIKVTAVSGTTWTVVRGQDGTSGASWSAGADVELRINVATIQDAINDLPKAITGGVESPDYVQFDTTATPTGAVGRLMWNDTDGTLEFQMKGGNVTLQIGQEQVIRVTNTTGSTISNGQAVYITGSTGSHVNAVLADASSEATSSKTLGLATEDIPNNQTGFVTTNGLVRGLNTSSLTEGAAVWLSTTAGAFTSTKPTQPDHSVLIGWCVKSHATVGVIYVHVANGFELQELHNVLITSAANNDVVSYETSTGLWKNRALATVANTGAYSDLTGTPTNVSSFTNDSGYITSASAAATYQPLDADLTAIASISGTSGLLKKDAANTWSLDTNTYLTSFTESDPVFSAHPAHNITSTDLTQWDAAYSWGDHASAGYLTANQTITLSGDVSGSGTTAITATLASSGVTAGSYTNANITVDAKGRVTAASNGSSGVTSFNTRSGAVTLTSTDVTTALTYTPANVAGDTFTGSITTTVDLISTGGRLSLYRAAGASYIDWSSGQSLSFRTTTSAGGAGSATLMTIDTSGDLALGVTPKAWSGLGGGGAFEFYGGALLSTPGGGLNTATLVTNAYYNGTNWIYNATANAGRYDMFGATHRWYTAPSGTGGNSVTFTQAMTLSSNGGLSVGTTTDPGTGKILAAKGILPRVNAQTTTASPWGWNSDNFDQQSFSALANALTISVDAGTPTDGEKQILRFKDNGTGRVLTFTGGSSKAFRDLTGQLTVSGSNWTYTTVANKTVYFGCVYNSADACWDIIAVTAQP